MEIQSLMAWMIFLFKSILILSMTWDQVTFRNGDRTSRTPEKWVSWVQPSWVAFSQAVTDSVCPGVPFKLQLLTSAVPRVLQKTLLFPCITFPRDCTYLTDTGCPGRDSSRARLTTLSRPPTKKYAGYKDQCVQSNRILIRPFRIRYLYGLRSLALVV